MSQRSAGLWTTAPALTHSLPKTVGFCDLLGTPYAPVSKITSVKGQLRTEVKCTRYNNRGISPSYSRSFLMLTSESRELCPRACATKIPVICPVTSTVMDTIIQMHGWFVGLWVALMWRGFLPIFFCHFVGMLSQNRNKKPSVVQTGPDKLPLFMKCHIEASFSPTLYDISLTCCIG